MPWNVSKLPRMEPIRSSPRNKRNQPFQTPSPQLSFSFPVASVKSDPLPTALLNSSFFDSSAQSVLNYKIPKEPLLVTFAVTVDSRNVLFSLFPYS